MESGFFWIVLGLIGFFIGAFGTLIGVAGGFILVPILLFLYPQDTPATITGITLAVAFFNALSGSIAYGHLKRIDFRTGLLFALFGVPGAVVGALLIGFLNRGVFQMIFGATLLLIAVYLMVRPQSRRSLRIGGFGLVTRRITDAQNQDYTYTFSLPLGMAIAFVVGVFSSLLGIGGGIIHVPALTQLMGFPAHIATATSHFMVAITTLTAEVTHLLSGVLTTGVRRIVALSIGAVIGAQFGARLSHRVSGVWIVRLLAGGLAIVGLRLLIAPF